MCVYVCVCVCVCACVCVCVLNDNSNFSPFTTIQTVRFHNSTLVQARKLIITEYVYLIRIYKFYEYRHVE